MDKKVWVLGSSNLDMTYRVKDIPLKGYTVEATSCMTATGGKGANQAVAAAHFGTQVGFIGAVGDDISSKMLLEVFDNAEIDRSHVLCIEKESSGSAIIFVDDQGDNCIAVHSGANKCIPTGMKPDFTKGDILVTQFEINIDAISHYFKLAKSCGVYTVINPSPYVSLSEEILDLTDMIVANESESSQMSGLKIRDVETAITAGKKILQMGPSTVVITLGAQGVVLVNQDDSLHITGRSVNVVDTQGAGDAFLGTLLAQLAKNKTYQEAISIANLVASLCVEKHGSTQVSMPTIDEIERYIKI
ncbi:MAG: ribokinase [Firmicutes bacterium HGW-Firmicutes-7]|nr:MAG: ribokinase [Firmicutes bacterium HGW-Firmicutes-7]